MQTLNNVIPIRNQVLVRPLPSENMSAGGIYVPDSFAEVNNKVKVIAVGRGTKQREMQLKPGMTAFRVKDWGQEIEIDGIIHYLMEDAALLAIEN